MNLEKLFKLQKELDSRIIDQHHLQDRTLISEKILALQVEIAELANETRCFKYWSNKKPASRDVILEEYVDSLHFILSIGLEFKFDDITLKYNASDSKATDQFVNIYIDITDFIVSSSKDHYITLFEDFMALGVTLNFTEDEIEDFYYKKNNINHERQASGY